MARNLMCGEYIGEDGYIHSSRPLPRTTDGSVLITLEALEAYAWPTRLRGWQCPQCGQVWAPHVSRCDCKANPHKVGHSGKP